MNLDHISLLDHHAHSVWPEAAWQTAPFAAYFTEAYDPQVLHEHTPHGVFFLRSVRDLAAFYGCEATRDAVLSARAGKPYLELSRRLIAAANIREVLIDDGFLKRELMSVEECGAAFPWTVRRILRLETELAGLVPQYENAGTLLDAFEALLRREAPNLAALKSVIAYRTGLDIRRWSKVEVEAAYTAIRRDLSPGDLPRISSQPLLDMALRVALRVACETRLPVQFHTGYGDPDLDLRLADPLLLRSLFTDPDLRGLQVVTLHCYPYTREAGYLASVYPGAYLDLGLTIPFTSQHAMRTHVQEALHLAPLSKLLFSTDASRTAELYYLGALWGRRMIGQVLEDCVSVGDLTAAEAEDGAVRLLQGNAGRLYPKT